MLWSIFGVWPCKYSLLIEAMLAVRAAFLSSDVCLPRAIPVSWFLLTADEALQSASVPHLVRWRLWVTCQAAAAGMHVCHLWPLLLL